MNIANAARSQGKFAVIGAGVSGLACARTLIDAGFSVQVFDKGRRPGGRVSSRTIESEGRTFSFDYGAKYFTARHPHFRAVVADLSKRNLAAPWPVAGKDAWVGTPAMATLVEALADGIEVAWGTTVTALSPRNGEWAVQTDNSGMQSFERLVLAMPAEQTAVLTETADSGLAWRAAASNSEPCWTLMLGFSERLPIADDILQGEDISSATRNLSRPSRQGCETWVVHAGADWSRRHLEHEPAAIRTLLYERFAALVGREVQPVYARAHRWRYAFSTPRDEGCYWNDAMGIGACGDWLLASDIESAWLSGRMLGKKIAGDGDAST